MLEGVWRHVAATLVPDVALQLLDARLLALDARLCLKGDAVVGVQLLLQLNDGLIALIQARSQSNHDVSLL